MELNVFFLPSAILATPETARDVYIVIDLIRATTSMTVMLEQGARRIYAAGTVEQARNARALYPQRLLCGERHVKPLPGFDYGNSPVQFAAADLRERELIMTTTNGTRAFHACPSTSMRLAGCLYNAEAVASKALALAVERQVNLHLVCSGELDAFALDDSVCAGYLVQEIQRKATASGLALVLRESALAAQTLCAAYPPPELIAYSDAAREVIEGGLLDDPPFCMRVNASQHVGMVVGQEEETGLLLIEQAD
ncbi:MAG TPA: 2-phosphosulfolactate phosphatase [Ktedonobacteraceae bacterium]|nr:2-phosphosulfolactate phosphatase [Ktedonobacteraceae bacterium]